MLYKYLVLALVNKKRRGRKPPILPIIALYKSKFTSDELAPSSKREGPPLPLGVLACSPVGPPLL